MKRNINFIYILISLFIITIILSCGDNITHHYSTNNKEYKYINAKKSDINSFRNTKDKENKLHIHNTLANKYFEYYLKNRPSKLANDALYFSIRNLYSAKNYEFLNDILFKINYNEKAWDKICRYVVKIYTKAAMHNNDIKIYEKGIKNIALLSEKVESKTAKAYFLNELGYYYLSKNKYKSKIFFNKIIKLNPNKQFVTKAKGYLYEIDNLNINQHAPLFNATDMSGKNISLKDFRGKIVLLHFYSMYCGPSIYQFPYLVNLYGKYKDKMIIISINSDDKRNKIKKLIDKNNFKWINILKYSSIDVENKYNIHMFPTIYIIDNRGKIRYKKIRAEEFDSAINHLINKK